MFGYAIPMFRKVNISWFIFVERLFWYRWDKKARTIPPDEATTVALPCRQNYPYKR